MCHNILLICIKANQDILSGGLYMFWFEQTTEFESKMMSRWEDVKICSLLSKGLCGSYNNRAEDDFMSSQNILEKTSQAFANSWEMMSCSKGNTASCISIEKGNVNWTSASVIKYLVLELYAYSGNNMRLSANPGFR